MNKEITINGVTYIPKNNNITKPVRIPRRGDIYTHNHVGSTSRILVTDVTEDDRQEVSAVWLPVSSFTCAPFSNSSMFYNGGLKYIGKFSEIFF